MQPVMICHYLDHKLVTFRSASQWIVLVSRDGELPVTITSNDRERALVEAKAWTDRNVLKVDRLER